MRQVSKVTTINTDLSALLWYARNQAYFVTLKSWKLQQNEAIKILYSPFSLSLFLSRIDVLFAESSFSTLRFVYDRARDRHFHFRRSRVFFSPTSPPFSPFLFPERSSAIAYQPRNPAWSVGAQQEAQWTEIASSRRWISNERGEKDVECRWATGPIERAEWERDNYRHFRMVLPRVALLELSLSLSTALPRSLSLLFFSTVTLTRAFIKINFDADLRLIYRLRNWFPELTRTTHNESQKAPRWL